MWSNISAPLKDPHEQVGGCQRCSPSARDQIRDSATGSDTKPQTDNNNGAPLMRYKHALCSSQSTGHIYIHGGRSGNIPLDDDIWRFDPHKNTWQQLQTWGQKPTGLQEHTLIEYSGCLYLFGGQVSMSNGDNSLWKLDLANQRWQSLNQISSKLGAHLGPTNRRAHSAVLYRDSMFVYGGFEDFRGSSDQLWQYDLVREHWELLNLSATNALQPIPRHSHSAVIYQDQMLIYGGLSNLKPLADLWRWSWPEKRWFKERTKGQSPGCLHGHSAIQAFDSMFVFGGERNGRPTKGLWRLNLTTMSWQKIRPKGPRPNAMIWHAAIANPLSIDDETNYIMEKGGRLKEVCLSSSDEANESATMANDLADCNENVIMADIETNRLSLSHSKSTSDGRMQVQPSMGATRTSTFKRKSRLNFMRRLRPRSSYELRLPHGELSAIDRQRPNSIQITPIPAKSDDPDEAVRVKLDAEANIDSQDHLDGKVLPSSSSKFSYGLNQSVGTRVDVPMSVDIQQVGSLMTITAMGANNSSVYETATIHGDFPRSKTQTVSSQLTSYAYNTPPSEMNTLREDPLLESPARQQLSRLTSKYDRRNNRPKSEIVQSLIDRADDRIKHLYTPFFGHQSSQPHRSSVGGTRNIPANEAKVSAITRQETSRHRQRDPTTSRHRLSLQERGGNHSISETMTYYNLYFSEDLSAGSPVADNQPATLFASQLRDQQQPKDLRHQTAESTDTIKVNDQESRSSNMSAVSVKLASQSSLEQNTSDTQTLCNEPQRLSTDSSSGDIANCQRTLTGGSLPVVSSLTNALTAKRDASDSCGDNTSLSFSAIAEFEEDDMLQYSSPTDFRPPERGLSQNERHEDDYEDHGNEMHDHEMIDHAAEVDTAPRQQATSTVAHKSSSSGYDSISIDEPAGPAPVDPPVATSAASDTTHDESSVRTEFSFNADTNTTDTSPERMEPKRRLQTISLLGTRVQRAAHKLASSSATADSLAMVTDSYNSDLCNNVAPETLTKSLPSSPPDDKSAMRRLPLVSRSARLFSKPKSRTRYWQLCMFVIGGKQNGSTHQGKEPITIWRLYI